MNEVRKMNGRLASLHPKRGEVRIPEFRVAAFSCKPPCVCDGFEVCLHQLHECGQCPIWPVFNAGSEEEARKIQGDVVKFARTLDPAASQYQNTKALEKWALENGWSKTHHVVWKKIAP